MLHKAIIDPNSIVVIGGSNSLNKPGGKILSNLIEGDFPGKLHVVNPKEKIIQGIDSYSDVSEIPNTDLAVICIPAQACLDVVKKQCL